MTTIAHCGRTVTEPVVAFDVRLEPPLPASASVEWAVVVSDGKSRVRLAVHSRDGDPQAQYVVDETTGNRHDVPTDADLGDGEVTARFPTDVVGVAAGWPTWTAVVSVDGEPVAQQVVAS